MQPVSASYDSKGRVTRIWEDDHPDPPRSSRLFAARRLDWDRRIASGDPGSKLSTPITDDGTKITTSLIGSWTSTDPYDGNNPYGIWPAIDPWGNPLSGTACGAVTLLLMTSDASSGDAIFASLALVNETDLTTATIDGRGMGFNYTSAGTFLGYSHALINGVYTSVATANNANSRGINSQIRIRDDNGSSSRLGTHSVNVTDSSWGYLVPGNGSGTVIFGAPRWYLAMVFVRTDAAVASTKTISAAAYYIAHPYTEFPA